MAYILKPSIEAAVERMFDADTGEYVKERLREAELPLDRGAPPPRVHAAVLWLARGDVERFDRALDDACMDWRDTLVAAGLAHEDWREVLAERGIDCSDW